MGAGHDLGAYEAQLLHCGDGNIDPGEACGEPGLGACAAPCTTCSGCTCAASTPVCGDALVCGAEQCESDGDCSGGQVCDACACVNPPPCTSGIVLEGAKLKAHAAAFSLKLSAELVIPKPWTGIAPATAGIRIVVGSVQGSDAIDATLPGGAPWKTNATGTAWTYGDPSGSVAGITKVVLKDRSSVESGRLRVAVKGKAASATLPDPADAIRTTLVLGAADECGALDWNGPGGNAPACSGDAASFSCR